MKKLLYLKPNTLIVKVEAQAMLAGSGISGGTGSGGTSTDKETQGVGADAMTYQNAYINSWTKDGENSKSLNWDW